MENLVVCALLGYLIGCLSPSWLFGKIKKKDLRTNGTGNLGATNTFLTVGKLAGVLVMVLDILKALCAVLLAQRLMPDFEYAGVLSGAFAVVGHIYPAPLRFKGGKGLACLGGVALGLQWRLFMPLLIIGVVAALVSDCGGMTAITCSVLFPPCYGACTGDPIAFLIILSACTLVLMRNLENLTRERDGTAEGVRAYFRSKAESRDR